VTDSQGREFAPKQQMTGPTVVHSVSPGCRDSIHWASF